MAGCIYSEQVLNEDFKDNYDTFLVLELEFDSSVGISQIKVSTAKKIHEKSYMPEIEKPSFIERLFGITSNGKIAIELQNNRTNIQYAAACLRYQINLDCMHLINMK